MTDLREGAVFSYDPVPRDPDYLPDYLEEHFARLQAVVEALLAGNLPVYNAAPARTYEGLVVLADGANWNPGSGQGVYCFYNSTWNYLG